MKLLVFILIISVYFCQQKQHSPDLVDSLTNIVSCVLSRKFNTAKRFWIQEVMKSPVLPGEVLDLEGEEDINGFRNLEPLLRCYLYEEICGKHSMPSVVSEIDSLMTLRINGHTADDIYKIITGRKDNGNSCTDSLHNGCKEKLHCRISVLTTSPPLVILAPRLQKRIQSTPLILELFKETYILFACSLYKPGHFSAAFLEDGIWYECDGLLESKCIVEKPLENIKHQYVKSCWYIKI